MTKGKEIIVDVDRTSKGVKRMLPVDTFLTEFVDGAGKTQTRIVFVAPGDKKSVSFILRDRAGGVSLAVQAHKWFEDGVNDALKGPAKKTRRKSVRKKTATMESV